MAFLYYTIITLLVAYAIYFIYKSEKDRELQLNIHLLQAKQILNNRDLKDKRNWFIDRFNEAENHLASAQASCAKEIEFQSVTDIRNKLQEIKENYKN
ncbi:MAG: hypothetical protein D8M58_08975 [Calditrichaeota bacterium]|nr:MAG: hypothetical protein DWQ03_17515 [Calditrichota bacterium]MBL1205517.1 hypothetical protein [Calditrichota bacterium]NOG45345.1 hypothetical protein [Calditrichota bacterium]